MHLPSPLIPARLLRRYKRFLADVVLPDGSEVTVHCPNPGSMMGLADPDTICWLSDHRGTSRKLPYGWELAELTQQDGQTGGKGTGAGGTETGGRERPLVGINTGLANAIVAEALMARRIPALDGYGEIRREVRVGIHSRLDFQLLPPSAKSIPPATARQPICFLEVKSVTLSRQNGLAEFPDARTSRGARHLLELAELAAAGHRAMLLFLVQRDDCTRLRCAADIDPAYAATLRQVAGAIEIRAYGCLFGRDQGLPSDITLTNEIPVDLT